jgi:hypothetical protein
VVLRDLVGQEFVLVFSPHWQENATALAVIAAFMMAIPICRLIVSRGKT